MLADGAQGRAIAEELAELKALHEYPHNTTRSLVLGADQVLVLDGELFSKAETLEAAAAQLRSLRGKPHLLVTARWCWRRTVLRSGGMWISRRSGCANSAMRFLRPIWRQRAMACLEASAVTGLKATGAQLFERVEGDYFSILGLPLLPLLAALRDHGVLAR